VDRPFLLEMERSSTRIAENTVGESGDCLKCGRGEIMLRVLRRTFIVQLLDHPRSVPDRNCDSRVQMSFRQTVGVLKSIPLLCGFGPERFGALPANYATESRRSPKRFIR
jgi:hypothetical protein